MPYVPKLVVKIGGANCQSYDGSTSEASWTARGKLMAAQHRHIWVVQETTQNGRKVLLKELGKTWKVWTLRNKTLAILFDSAVLDYSTVRSVTFGTAFGHGALLVRFKVRSTGEMFDVVAVHIRPKSVATLAGKLLNLRSALKLTERRPTVMGGDFALNNPPMAGWKRLTPKQDSMDKKGTQTPDALYGKYVGSTGGVMINPGRLSDHMWYMADVTIGENTPTN